MATEDVRDAVHDEIAVQQLAHGTKQLDTQAASTADGGRRDCSGSVEGEVHFLARGLLEQALQQALMQCAVRLRDGLGTAMHTC